MLDLSKISSTADSDLERRLPPEFRGLDLNFCRNPTCASYGVSPDPFKRPKGAPPAPPDAHPEFYRRYGKTANGASRFQCSLCKKTFSIGKPARRHLRSDKNRVIFKMLCNDVSLSKICKITDTSYRDLYGKIDFFHDQIQGFIAQREDFRRVDFEEVGSRFATDSQTLILNWPTKRKRTPVTVQHLCTAHHRSGDIMEAAFQFDPSMTMQQAEVQALDADEADVSVAFRQHARVWTQSEFDQYLIKLRKQEKLPPNADLYQLPHDGALVRHDILQCAHALRVREML